MANLYFPTSSKILERVVTNGAYTEVLLNVVPNTVFFFDSASNLVGQSVPMQLTASNAVSASISDNAIVAQTVPITNIIDTDNNYPVLLTNTTTGNVPVQIDPEFWFYPGGVGFDSYLCVPNIQVSQSIALGNTLNVDTIASYTGFGGTTKVSGSLNVTMGITASNVLIGGKPDNAAHLYISGSPNQKIMEVDTNTGAECFEISSVGGVFAPSFTGSVASLTSSNSQTPIQIISNVNNWSEIFVQNASSGTTASTDIALTNNSGSTTTYFIDVGINGSGYRANWVGQANEGYLFLTSSNIANLYLGNSNPDGEVVLFAGGYANTGSGLIVAKNSITASYLITGSITNARTASYMVPTYYSSSLLSSVALTSNNVTYNGPTIGVLPAGTYMIGGFLTLWRTAGATGSFTMYLQNGTSVYASTEGNQATTTNTLPRVNLGCSTIATLPSGGSITASCKSTNASGWVMAHSASLASSPSGSNACQVWAYKIG